MSALRIEQFLAAKREREACAAWAALLGAPYNGGGGGGGGVGRLVMMRLAMGESAPTIYHQFNNGAQNYHRMPAALAMHLEDAIIDNFPALLAAALERQRAAVRVAAEAALREHRELVNEAGLSLADLPEVFAPAPIAPHRSPPRTRSERDGK